MGEKLETTKSTKMIQWILGGFIGIIMLFGILSTVITDEESSDINLTDPPTVQQPMF